MSKTALAVARVRAHESAAGNALFDDPYAAAFLAAAGEQMRKPTSPGPLATALRFQTVIRTRFYDDELIRSGHAQVVLLAAGLDTRAYRLPWPSGTRLYELDLPPVLEFKHGVLAAQSAAPRCDRTAVAADLLRPTWADRLVDAGFDATRPTAWLVEGLLVYLTAEEAATLLTTVGDLSAPGSRLALERGRSGRTRLDDPSVAHITALWKGGLGAGTADWLDAHGWRSEAHPLDTVAACYGRPMGNPSGTGFITAVRTSR
ncbi:SAM-dependent methyltransferase [Streptomyces kaniharaensis]|uniref:SAM-dependent methyltransferase n=1 Tax=Streptomyces kaniharaensis TaxID=212423 RepID=UPI002DDD040C|nr:SAM-dependent methyltransferase [Streptomyces kaniharaensis]